MTQSASDTTMCINDCLKIVSRLINKGAKSQALFIDRDLFCHVCSRIEEKIRDAGQSETAITMYRISNGIRSDIYELHDMIIENERKIEQKYSKAGNKGLLEGKDKFKKKRHIAT